MPAAGRNQVGYDDIGYDGITQKIDGTTITYDVTKANGIGVAAGTGLAVTFTADDTVGLCADGDAVIGKLLKVDSDGFCTVMTDGFTTLPSNGTITRGTKAVGALSGGGARGYIRSANSATAAELIKEGPIIWATGDATNVVVEFD